MKTLLLIIIGLWAGSALADGGSAELKAEGKSLVQQAGYACEKVDAVYPAAFGGSVTVICDDSHRYIVRNKDGHYSVEVEE
nr:hypothetical protein [uncultured Enterobacter sp.]